MVARRTLRPPSFYIKANHKISHARGALPALGRKKHSCHWRLGGNAEMDVNETTDTIALVFLYFPRIFLSHSTIISHP